MSIVDVVYGQRTKRPQSRHLVAVLVALSLHLAVVAFAARAEPGLGPWSAALALAVHDELARETVVTMDAPPPPPKEQPRLAFAPRPAAAAPAPVAAQAAQVITAAPAADAPVDFDSFVQGSGDHYAGGVTDAKSTSDKPAETVAAKDESLPVRLAADEWSCPWPSRAVSEHIDEQSVVIKVLVREDGSAVEAKVVRDAPGGFGEAALACSKRTTFLPARDKSGAVIRQWSPPIEVRFSR